MLVRLKLSSPRRTIPSPGESIALGDRILSGDDDARAELIERVIPVALNLANRATRDSPHLTDDCVDAALLELVECAGRWDCSRHNWFVYYFKRLARRKIRRVIFSLTLPFELPPRVCWVRRERWPDTPWIPKAAFAAVKMTPDALHLGHEATAESGPDMVETRDEAATLTGILPPRERDLVERHHGIGGQAPQMLRDIGPDFGVGSSMRYYLHGRALGRMRCFVPLESS
jgi:hypothetical protein